MGSALNTLVNTSTLGLVGDSGSNPVFNGQLGNAIGLGAYQPGSVQFDRSQFDPNQQEQDLTQALLARAYGNAPSAAEMQQRRGLDMASRQAASFAASQRGVSPAMAARLAQQGQQQLQTDGIGQASQLRAAEQQRAETLASGLIQDQRQGRAAREELGVRSQLGVEGLRAQAEEGAAGRRMGFLSSLGEGVASAMGGMNQGGMVELEVFDNPYAGFADDLTVPKIKLGEVEKKEKRKSGGAKQILGLLSGMPMMNGGKVPGQAVVSGDSPKNDFVKALLSPGEIIIPRTVAQKGPDAVKSFAQKILEKEGKR